VIKFILFISIYLSTSILLSQKGDTLFISSIYKEALTKGESYENLRKLCKDIGNRLSGSAAAQMVESIIRYQKRIFPVCIELQGEYGIKDCFLGVPVVLGRNGVERVIELKLNEEEKALLNISHGKVKEVMNVLDNMPATA
jgi:malate/lactate dehydrogenase